MLLKVQEYNFEVVFKHGSEIPVDDTLSRAPNGKPIYTEVVAVNNTTLKDDTLKVLGDVIPHGWPNEKQHVQKLFFHTLVSEMN